MEHIGIDVHKQSSQVCILTESGELLERRLKTRREAEKAHALLERFESAVTGPCFRGQSFSLLDASMTPFLQRLWWMHEIVDLGVFTGVDKVTAWTRALLERPSVKASAIPTIQTRFHEYMRGDRRPSTKMEPSWMGRQL